MIKSNPLTARTSSSVVYRMFFVSKICFRVKRYTNGGMWYFTQRACSSGRCHPATCFARRLVRQTPPQHCTHRADGGVPSTDLYVLGCKAPHFFLVPVASPVAEHPIQRRSHTPQLGSSQLTLFSGGCREEHGPRECQTLGRQRLRHVIVCF